MTPSVETAAQAVEAMRVAPGTPPAEWQVRVPGSKSLTNRALLLAGLAEGRSWLRAPLRSDDTDAMAGVLRALGAEVAADGDDVRVDGLAGPPRGAATIDCRMSGTTGRFALPALAAGEGRFTVDGHPQLRRRPFGPVLDALRAQGAAIEGESLPLVVGASGLSGGDVSVDTSVSSQFLSGLLMAAPLARTASTLRFGALVSAPYLELTVAVMSAFGVAVTRDPGALRLEASGYRAADYVVEPDASTASYFLAAAALTGTTVTLPGLDLDATAQGDAELVDHLVAMGATIGARAPLRLRGPARLRGVHVGMGDASDVFMTLACVAPFADGPTTIEGIGHVRVKESDRLAATAENLRRLGVEVQEGPDWMRVLPGPVREAVLPTYEDHRIAMAFALLGARVPVVLRDPGVVAKTCPTFWELWRATGAAVQPLAGAGR